MSLTKQDLIQDLSGNLRLTKNESADLIEKLLELMKSILASGEDLVISRFGKFEVRKKPGVDVILIQAKYRLYTKGRAGCEL